MNDVDYLLLSQQYANFLVAVGGVSITVLTLVLAFPTSPKLAKGNVGSFLVLALVVATVCCFIGAQMMAETTAFISYSSKEKTAKAQQSEEISPEEIQQKISLGKRLFLLASINIFLAIILVSFALMLLSATFKLPDADGIQSISLVVFVIVVLAALYWMVLGVLYRIDVNSGLAIFLPIGIGIVFCLILCFFPLPNKSCWWLMVFCWWWLMFIPIYLTLVFLLYYFGKKIFLWLTFSPIVLFIALSLFYFTWIFKDGNNASIPEACDVWFISFAISLSYAPLVAAAVNLYTVLRNEES